MTQSAVREVSRGSFYLGLEQLAIIVGGLLYSIMVLRMLGPAMYGILTLGQAAIGLAGVLTTNIESYLERFVAEFDSNGMGGVLRRLVTRVMTTKVFLALVAMALVIVLADPYARFYKYPELRRLLPVLAPLVLLEGAGWSLRVTLFGLQRFRSIWIVALLNNLLKLVIIAVLWYRHEGVVALVCALVAVQLVTVVIQGVLALRYLPRSSGPDSDVPTHRRIWQYVLPLLGGRVFFLSGQYVNRQILGLLMPAKEFGLVAAAMQMLERFIALAGAVPNALLPTLSRLHGEKNHDAIERVVTEGYRLVTALSVAMMAGILCLAREAMLISGGPEYLGAVLPLEILSLVPLFRTMQQPLNMSFYTYEKTRTVFWLAGLKFAVEPLLYPLLIPRFGVSGVAISSLLSSVVVFFPTSYIADRLFPATAGLRRAQTLQAWGIAGVTCVAFFLTHRLSEPWPRLAVRIAILAAALALLLFVGRMVRGEDLRSLARVTRRPRAERALQTTAAWLDRVQGRVGRATIAG